MGKMKSCYDQPARTRLAKFEDLFFNGSVIEQIPFYIKGAQSGVFHVASTFFHMNEKRFIEAINEGRIFIDAELLMEKLKLSMPLNNNESTIYTALIQKFIIEENPDMAEVEKYLNQVAPVYMSENAIKKILHYLSFALGEKLQASLL